MINLVLQHLEQLQLDLAAIDPARDLDATDKVASLASALRHVVRDAVRPEMARFEPSERTAERKSA